MEQIMAKKKTRKKSVKKLNFWQRVANGWKKFFSSAWSK
jgi:hypothetical protein|tara:strand:+ start:495 stop:611 length:117 start_codon:yes stop_codon:yes gene_type:complete